MILRALATLVFFPLIAESKLQWKGFSAFVDDHNVTQDELGVQLTLGADAENGAKAMARWGICSWLDSSQMLDGAPQTSQLPGQVNSDFALNMTGYDRVGFWVHSDGGGEGTVGIDSPRLNLSLGADNCTSDGADYYISRPPIDIDWTGWRWISVSLNPGLPEFGVTVEDVRVVGHVRRPLHLRSQLQYIMLSENIGRLEGLRWFPFRNPSVSVTLGGAAAYKSPLEKARTIFTGLESGRYIRRHEVTFHEQQSNIFSVHNITNLPNNVKLNWNWRDQTNRTIIVELSANATELVKQSKYDWVTSVLLQIVIDPGLPFPPCQLKLEWARSFKDIASLEEMREAVLSKEPLAWGTNDQYELATARSMNVTANAPVSISWRNLTVNALYTFASEWPASYVDKWESASENGTWVLPPSGGQVPGTYPITCVDGTTGYLDYSTSTFACPSGSVPPRECPSDETSALYEDGVFTCENNDTATMLWSRWPYTVMSYDMQHSELALSAYKLALAYKLGAGEAAAEAAWKILIAYGERYTSYHRHTRDQPPIDDPYYSIQEERGLMFALDEDTPNSFADMGATDNGRVHSQAMEEVIFLHNIAIAYDLLRDSPSYNETTAFLVENGILRPGAAILFAFTSPGNHQTVQNQGLAVIGMVLQDFALVQHALTRPEWSLMAQFDPTLEYVMPGGIWFENSFSYHMVSLHPLVVTAISVLRTGHNYFSTLEGPLRDMIALPLKTMMPDTMTPPMNDARYRWLEGYIFLYELAYYGTCYTADGCEPESWKLLEHSRKLYRTTANYEGIIFGMEPPTAYDHEANEVQSSASSFLLAEAGFAVLRCCSFDVASTENDMSYMIFDFAPHGGYHGHFDKLNIITYAGGSMRANDAASSSPKLDNWKGYFHTTISHNTVVMNNASQLPAEGNATAFFASRVAPMVSASALMAYEGVSEYERTLILTKEYLLDIFNVKSNDNSPQTWDWAYHDSSGTNVNIKGTDRADGLLPTCLANGNDPVKVNISSLQLPDDSGYNFFNNMEAYDEAETWEIIFNLPQEQQTYSEFNGKTAGYCSYAYSSAGQIDAAAQNVTWAPIKSINQNQNKTFLSAIQFDYDFTEAETFAKTTITLDATAENVPAEYNPAGVSVSFKGNSTVDDGIHIYTRIYDTTNTYKIAKLGEVSYELGWQAVFINLTDVAGDLVPPLDKFVIELYWWDGVGVDGVIVIADPIIVFEDGSEVLWSPVTINGGSDVSTSGTRLLSTATDTPTKAFVGLGLEGEDASVDVPAVVLRRETSETSFSVVHEYWKGNPGSAVTSFQHLQPNCGYHVQLTTGWDDYVVSSSTNNCSKETVFTGFNGTVQATYAYCRLDQSQVPHRLAATNATKVGKFLVSESPLKNVDVIWNHDGNRIEAFIELDEEHLGHHINISIQLADIGALELYVNNKTTSFTVANNSMIAFRLIKETKFPTNSPTKQPVASVLSSTPTKQPVASVPTSTPTKQPITSVLTSTPTKQPITSVPTRSPVGFIPTNSSTTFSPSTIQNPTTDPDTLAPSVDVVSKCEKNAYRTHFQKVVLISVTLFCLL